MTSLSPEQLSLNSANILEELITCIQNGDIRRVEDILRENKKSVNLVYKKTKDTKTTALITAIKRENIEIIKLLIEKGANVEQDGGRSKFMESPLFHAIATHNVAVIKLILEKCDVNKKIGERRFSALHEAVETMNEVAVSMLIRHPNINPNIQDQDHNTPLHIAVEKDLRNIVKILIEGSRKIDLNLKNKNGLKAEMVNTSGGEQACKLVEQYRCGIRQPAESEDAGHDACQIQQEVSPPVSSEHTFDDSSVFLPWNNENARHVSRDVPDNDDVDRGSYAGCSDSFSSMNQSSLPPSAFSPGRDKSVSSSDGSFLDSPQQSPTRSGDHSLARSRYADQSDSMHQPCGGYALIERSDMGSIPIERTPPDNREVALHGNIACDVARLELSTAEVCEEHPPECLLQRKLQVGNNTGTPHRNTTNATREPTIRELKYNHIRCLSNYLDPPSGVGNYRELGLCIFKGNKDLVDSVNRLYLAHVGGGSPGTALLNYLKVQGYTLREFVHVAKTLNRNDVVVHFAGLNDEELDGGFDNLEPSIVRRVSNLLELNAPGIRNWKDFAFSCGCSDENVDEFATAVTANLMTSPTEALVNLMKTNLPSYKLSELKSHLSTIRRNDVISYLDSIVLNVTP